tara:strand:- start:141 stop:764 length:624 start_codon:yes stop_codon:yes gene_type:complete
MNITREVNRLFPTIVETYDNVLEEEYIDSMTNDIIKSSKEVGREENWQSEHNPNLHEHLKYKALGSKVLELSKVYLDDLKYEYEKMYITGMWSNILKPGETHSPHTHSNNLLSGVFYLQSNDNSPAITFVDPRPQASVLQPQQTEYTKDNGTLFFYPAKVNRMLLFPSWLQHYVPKNNSNDNRISIAFNVMLRGRVGQPSNFQTNKF